MRQAWGSVARGWQRWWQTFEAAAQVVSDALTDAANVQPGDTVLDVATGIGEPAVTAARRVGPAGRVVGIDQAEPMLAVATRRMASLGLTNLEFREMDAEAIDLEGPFDAVLCRWGLMFLPDLDRALARVVTLMRPGARFAAAVWGTPEDVPMLDLPMRVAREVLRAPPPPPDAPSPFSLHDLDALADRLHRVGLRVVARRDLPVSFEFDSPQAFVAFVADVSAGVNAAFAQAESEKACFWKQLEGAVDCYRTADGRIRFTNVARLIAAERSAVRCPFCESTDTRLETPFGSTLGFAQYWCERCRTVFEYLKWEEQEGDAFT